MCSVRILLFFLLMQVSQWNQAWAKNSQEVVGKVCLMLSLTVTLIWECRTRLVSIAAQKFVGEIASDALLIVTAGN
jgi:hypothetical protein